MDLKELIAKMDQIEQQPVQEDIQQVNEVAPIVWVGVGMGLKWLWDKYQESQAEADAAKRAAEEAKRQGDAAEAARLAAEAAKKEQEAAADKKRAEDAYNSKCKQKVGDAEALLKQLEDLVKAKTKPAAVPAQKAPAPAAANSGIAVTPAKTNENFNIADSLVESFGYTLEKKDQIDEWSKQDTGDTIRGAYNGLTFGAGDNISAGFKSAFGKETYAQALAREREETARAQARSPSIKFNAFGKEWNPSAYDAANLVGAVAVPIPGVGLAGAAAAKGAKAALGTGKVAKGVAGTAKLGTGLGVTYGALKGSEHVLSKHNVTTLVTAKGGDVRLGMAQAAMGMDDKEVDGKMGKLTRTALEIVQQDNNLPVTGKLDDATAKVLSV